MKPITIVGGGLAGLTLGILLRHENVPVAVIEAGKYPRHRVCGEFISGRGRAILQQLGIEQELPQRIEAQNCSFHLKNRRAVRLEFKEPALCVSRYVLDALLAEEFERLGGILKTDERANVAEPREGVIRATGRRRAENSVGHLFGLKAHALGASLPSDLEMHFGRHNYVGLCRVGTDRVNVCGLFFSERAMHGEWRTALANSVWSEALRDAKWDEHSFSSVAGLTLSRQAPEDHFSIGDAAAMIPPLSGNGMSMAFESAEKAYPLLLDYSFGRSSWSDALQRHHATWRQSFSSRLRWAGFIQSLVFTGAGQKLLLVCSRLMPSLPTLFFSRTR
jgi:menaquinone-9 beta-reductase